LDNFFYYVNLPLSKGVKDAHVIMTVISPETRPVHIVFLLSYGEMSKLQFQQNKFSVASRTAYDVLPVESGEESEQEEEESEPEPVVLPVVCVAISS
jgi:hypothetical protein